MVSSSALLCGVLSLSASTAGSSSPLVASARATTHSFITVQPGLVFQSPASGRASSASDAASSGESANEQAARRQGAGRDKSYGVLAIIGAEGSGKSTLLNAAFGTAFPVQGDATGVVGATASAGRRTTQGAWLDLWNDWDDKVRRRLVLMDVEGAAEGRARSRHSFDARSTLLALALADVIVLNVGAHDLGCEGTSGFDPAVLALALGHLSSATAAGAWAAGGAGGDGGSSSSRRNGGILGRIGGMGRALTRLGRWRPGPLHVLCWRRVEQRNSEADATAALTAIRIPIPRKHLAVVLRDVEGGPGGEAFATLAVELWRRLCLAAGGASPEVAATSSTTASPSAVAAAAVRPEGVGRVDWTRVRTLPLCSVVGQTCDFTVSFHALPCGAGPAPGSASFARAAFELRDTCLQHLEATRAAAEDDKGDGDDENGNHDDDDDDSKGSKSRKISSSGSSSDGVGSPRVPLGDFGRFAEALWDAVGARAEGVVPCKRRSLNLGPAPVSLMPASGQEAEMSYLGASLANLCLAPLLLEVAALDTKVRASAEAVDCGAGPPCLEFGAFVRALLLQADAAVQAVATDVGLVVATDVPAAAATAVGSAAAPAEGSGAGSAATASAAAAPGSAVAAAAACRLRNDVRRCLEPTLGRHLASCAAYALLAFEDAFSSLLCVPGLPCGKGSDFALRADALVAEALATFDAAAAAAEPSSGELRGKGTNEQPRSSSGSSRRGERAALDEELQRKVADRRAEGGTFGGASDDEDDVDTNEDADAADAQYAGGPRPGWSSRVTRKGLSGAWAKLPRLWKVLLSRVLPLAVNWVQSMHTLISRRRAAQRQDALLPVMPLF